MTKNQFDILTYLEARRTPQTQRALSSALEKSIGSINKTIGELTDKGWMQEGSITDAGLAALEPYRVKRAVFLAAGFGSRLVPLTLSTPKPLIRVKGVRLIDTMLDAVVKAGIEEILIVRGYLGEQFDQLLHKYPTIRFIENPLFSETNNISSALYAKDYLQGAYILEADLLLYNPALITKYQYNTNYLGAYVETTDDWCFLVKNGYIQKLTVGATECYQMVGCSYWTEADGKRLAQHIEEEFHSPGGKERYWDQVALEYHAKEYKVAVRPCQLADIAEIDTCQELVRIDPAYGTGGLIVTR